MRDSAGQCPPGNWSQAETFYNVSYLVLTAMSLRSSASAGVACCSRSALGDPMLPRPSLALPASRAGPTS